MKNPQRGEVWITDFGYAAKIRPAVVLSVPALDEDRAPATMVLHTTSVRGTRFEVDINARFLRKGAFECRNLTTVSHAQLERKIGVLTAEQMQLIEDTVRRWLAL